MGTLLGIPLEGWKAISVWLFVLVVPWTYGLYFLRRLSRSGVPRWGGRASARNNDGGAGR